MRYTEGGREGRESIGGRESKKVMRKQRVQSVRRNDHKQILITLIGGRIYV